MHCMSILCRQCMNPHLEMRHPNNAPTSSGFDLYYPLEDVHFLSPRRNSKNLPKRSEREQSSSTTDVVDGDDVANSDDVNEDEGDEEDLEYNQRASIQEEQDQYEELIKLQQAMDHWTRKEMELKRQQQQTKQTSIYANKPIPCMKSARESQQRQIFSITYAVFVTLLVWGIYGIAIIVASRVRDNLEYTLTFLFR